MELSNNSTGRFLLGLTQPVVTQQTLICFPYAGGGASVFRGWRQLAENKSTLLFGVQYAGRESRFNEPLANCHFAMACDIAGEIIKHVGNHGRLVLFGHSFGAAIAFEVVRELERLLLPPSLLVVSGRPAPCVSIQRQPVVDLPDEQFLQRIIEYKGFPDELLENSEFMEIVLPILRSDFEISERFDHVNRGVFEPISVPLLALGATNDPWLSQTALGGWKDYTTGTFSTQWFEGGHFFINDDVAPIIERILDR